MNILQTLQTLRDDLKTWVVNNLSVLHLKIDNKVEKIPGKGLSTNDFTNAYKSKLDNLDNKAGAGVFIQTTEPAQAKEGDIWLDTSDVETLYAAEEVEF